MRSRSLSSKTVQSESFTTSFSTALVSLSNPVYRQCVPSWISYSTKCWSTHRTKHSAAEFYDEFQHSFGQPLESRIQTMRPKLDLLFDKVLVNAPDEALRRNRLTLLLR